MMRASRSRTPVRGARSRCVPALLVLAGLLAPGALPAGDGETSATRERPTRIERLAALEARTVELIRRSKPAFVFIGGGSGFCISPDGWVLTNEHVVRGQSEVTVHFAGGRRFRAEVTGHDPQGDIALLKLRDAEDVPWLELGESDGLEVGQRVLALGDPFLIGSQNLFLQRVPPDYEPSASLGVVSALHRYSGTYNDAIQVDLAVNRGNSGGPLITFDGKVVGINGKIETRFALGINTGVGYAIPSDQIRRFLEPLKEAEGGQVRHGTIVGLEVAERAGDREGLPVTGVADGSPAAEAGFREGDLILEVDGLRVRTGTRWLGVLATWPEGSEVPVQVRRGAETLEVRAVLVGPGKPYLGVRTESIVEGGEERGVRVTRVLPRTPAARAGLREGDVIVEFGSEDVGATPDLARLIGEHDPGDVVRLEVRRDGERVELEVRLGSRAE